MAIDHVDVEPSIETEPERPEEGAFCLRERFELAIKGVGDTMHRIQHGEYEEDFLRDHHAVERYKADYGTEHDVRIYNPQNLERPDRRTPLVHIFPLAVRDDHGIEIRKLSELTEAAKWQRRTVITIGSEGFASRLSPGQLKGLTLEQCAANLHSVLNRVEERHGHDLSEVIFSGASRGGTLSYLAADQEIAGDRKVKAIIPVAGPGFRDLSLGDQVRAGIQFGFVEPAYMARRALSPDSHRDIRTPHYAFRLIGTAPKLRSLPAVARTGLSFLTSAPLKGIHDRMHPDTKIYDMLLDNDGITARAAEDLGIEHDGLSEIEEALVVAGIHMHCTEGKAIEHIKGALAEID